MKVVETRWEPTRNENEKREGEPLARVYDVESLLGEEKGNKFRREKDAMKGRKEGGDTVDWKKRKKI